MSDVDSQKKYKKSECVDAVDMLHNIGFLKNLEIRLTRIEDKTDKILDKLERVAPQWRQKNE